MLDITISVAVQRKCSLESGLQKVTFFFLLGVIVVVYVCLFVLSQC